ncbi:MAG TPA: hypothetical protein VGI31_02415 [Streptosporangiaceae bacterium]|jgi:hypothetical protein
MELSADEPGPGWAPQACTLPDAQRPQRAAQFSGLFGEAVLGVERAGPTRLLIDLRPSPQVAGRVAELVTAETGCCSFFTFTLTMAASQLVLEVTVPDRHIDVLDGLAAQAAADAAAAP